MSPTQEVYQPYAAQHASPQGPGDARPTAAQVIADTKTAGTLTGKTILITGCTGGLGIEIARALYLTGAQLFLGGRDTTKLTSVISSITSSHPNTTFPAPIPLTLDLTSLTSVRTAAATFLSQSTRLDILICNAGIMAAPYTLTPDNLESHWGVNHIAHFQLIHSLLPTLLKTSTPTYPSRVILVSSQGHRRGAIDFSNPNSTPERYIPLMAYAQSKLANVWTANALNRKYEGKGVLGLSLHPGIIMTDLARHMSAEEVAGLGLDQPEVARLMKSVEQGAATTVWGAVEPWFVDGKRGGRYLSDVGVAGESAEPGNMASEGYGANAFDVEGEERLWRLSCETIGAEVEG